MDIRNTILTTLCDGEFHSGEHLASLLGVSRAAVSNHMKALQHIGLEIFSVTGKGYRLAQPLTLLDATVINDQCGGKVNVLNVIDSTNQFVKDNMADLSPGEVCVAEAQTAGRGRHGRVWQSPFGANVYLSMYWHFDGGYGALDGLSLLIGVAVADALDELYGIETQLKWPNDIYVDNRKLGGVLVEVEGQFGGTCNTVIGIGLNIAMPESVEIDQPWIDLAQLTDTPIDRNKVVASLVNSLRSHLADFEQSGFAPFVNPWTDKNVFKDKAITLTQGEQVSEGICRGIDSRGGLLVEQDGRIKAHYGGEISVRARQS